MNLGLWQYRLRACCGLRFTVKVKASIGGFLRHGGEAGFIGMSDIRMSRIFVRDFNAGTFDKSPQECETIARKIIENLHGREM